MNDTGPTSQDLPMFEQLEMSSPPLTSSWRGSPVNRSLLLDAIAERLTSGTSGLRPSESFARYDPDSRCWRTSQASLLTGTLAEYSATWPKQGTMRNGSVSEPRTSGRPTSGSGSSLWRTPASKESGIAVERLEGEIGSRMYDKETGRLAQYGLPQQVAKLWPTPVRMDHRPPNDEARIAVKMRGQSRYGLELRDAATMWPTPKGAAEKMGLLREQDRGDIQAAAMMWPTPRSSPNENRTTHNAPSHGVSHGKTLAGEAGTASLQAPATSTPGHECSPKCRRLNPLSAGPAQRPEG